MKLNIINDRYKNAYLIYTRKSTDDAHNQKNSIDYQVDEGIRFSNVHNLTIADITISGFCDHGIIKERHSGFKQDKDFEIINNNYISQKVERPKFLTLIAFLKKKAIKGVICLCWDRISRNENDDVLIKKLISSGIDFRFVQVTYDTTSSGALHMDIDGMFSRHYSRVISEKVSNALHKLRSQGKCTYPAPIGYLNQGSDNKILDPQTAPLIKSLFELYAGGQWSLSSLMRWAHQQNICCRPRRRKRTKEEKLQDAQPVDIPKIAHLVSKRTIENILKNQFYIGKIKDRGIFIQGMHPPLIDSALFFKVQFIMQQKNRMYHKPQEDFYIYRGLIRCPFCKRMYSPYTKKGINYLMLKCKAGCKNTQSNIRESVITDSIQELLNQLYFSEQELMDIEANAVEQLNNITDRRNKELTATYTKLDKAIADLDYLCKEKISFLRKGMMTVDEIKTEEARLHHEIEDYKTIIKANVESSEHMLSYVITFSQIIKESANYFKYALDSEKVEIITQIFSELYYSQAGLKYIAKQGFSTLFARNNKEVAPFGAAYYLFSELERIYAHTITGISFFKQIMQ